MAQPEHGQRTSAADAEQLIADTGQLNIDERHTSAYTPATTDEQASLVERLAGVTIPITQDVPDNATGTTAFFLFSNVHRQQVRDALQQHLQGSEKLGIGQIGKKIGEMWGQCNDETKKKYVDHAKQNKEKAKSCGNGTGETDGEQTHAKEAPLKLPRSVVKRIIMLDEEQSRITGDALELISTTAELFLETVAKKAYTEAVGAARSSLAFRDVDAVLRRWRPTGWAASPFLELEPESKPDSQAQNKSFVEAAAKTKSITRFFKPVA